MNFKIGDRVKVYSRHYIPNVNTVYSRHVTPGDIATELHWNTNVLDINEYGMLYVDGMKIGGNMWVHPKQCRKLIKKERMAFYVLVFKDAETIDSPEGLTFVRNWWTEKQFLEQWKENPLKLNKNEKLIKLVQVKCHIVPEVFR